MHRFAFSVHTISFITQHTPTHSCTLHTGHEHTCKLHCTHTQTFGWFSHSEHGFDAIVRKNKIRWQNEILNQYRSRYAGGVWSCRRIGWQCIFQFQREREVISWVIGRHHTIKFSRRQGQAKPTNINISSTVARNAHILPLEWVHVCELCGLLLNSVILHSHSETSNTNMTSLIKLWLISFCQSGYVKVVCRFNILLNVFHLNGVFPPACGAHHIKVKKNNNNFHSKLIAKLSDASASATCAGVQLWLSSKNAIIVVILTGNYGTIRACICTFCLQ